MKFKQGVPREQKHPISHTGPEGKSEILWGKVTYLFLAIAFSSLLFTYGGCASSPQQSGITLPPQEQLDSYIQTADHLTDKQKKDLARRRPFVGMTLEEANLSMYRESVDSILSGRTFRAVYVGEAGVKYYLYFQGEPPRVAKWSQFSRGDIELMDPDKLRPSPPGLR
jgi:hypothetical protein